MPPDWVLGEAAGVSGWRVLLSPLDNIARERNLLEGGWTFFFLAHVLAATAAGWNRGQALTRLLTLVRGTKCNCVEIETVGGHSFLGVPYERITGHARNIQQGARLGGK